jgi:phosphatidylglycerol---prolipoprotein diacylglyceryl transferase
MSPVASLFAIPFPAIDPVALQIGPIAIRWYGLAYVAGLLLGWLYVKRLLATPRFWRDDKPPFAPALADDLFMWVAIGVIVGGRLGHALLYEPGYYLSRPLEILYVWQGGMAFHGGMLGTIIAMWLFARRQGVSALGVMDIVSAAVPIGLLFGRIANFINVEVVGRETNVPWGIIFPGWGNAPRHPVQLYEAALEGLVLYLILRHLIYRHRALATPGLIGAAFLAGYGTFRIFCEFFKHDEYRTLVAEGWLTTGMIYSIPMALFGFIAYFVLRRPRTAA